MNADYGGRSYASLFSQFLEQVDESVNNRFRCYSAFTLEKTLKAHVKILQQDLKNKKISLETRSKGFLIDLNLFKMRLDVRSFFTRKE